MTKQSNKRSFECNYIELDRAKLSLRRRRLDPGRGHDRDRHHCVLVTPCDCQDQVLPFASDSQNSRKRMVNMLIVFKKKLREDPVAIMERIFQIVAGDSVPESLFNCCLKTLWSILIALLEKGGECRRSQLIEMLYSVLEQNQSFPVVQREVVRMMEYLISQKSVLPQHCEKVPQPKRAISLLFRTMHLHLNDLGTTSLYFELLRRLAAPMYCSYDEWLPGIQVMMKSLKVHSNSTLMLQHGFAIFAWLAEGTSCRQAMIEQDGIEFAFSMLEINQLESNICCNTAAVLCWLIHAGLRESESPIAQRQARLMNNVTIVVNALENNLHDPAAFGNLTCLLCAMPETPRDFGMLQVIIHGMKHHISAPKVQEGCIRWLRSKDLGACNDDLKIVLVPMLLLVGRHHENNLYLQIQLFELFVKLAGVPDLCESMLQNGAIDLVFSSMRAHSGDLSLQQSAGWFLTLCLPLTPAAVAFGGGLRGLSLILSALDV